MKTENWHFCQRSCGATQLPAGGAHPCFAVDIGLLLQQELHHLDVAVVTRDVERSVTHLTGTEK